MRDLNRHALHVERRGTGEPLALVHGFTQTGRSWSAVADDLARDHEVLLVDAPGHGDSKEIGVDLAAGADLLAAAVGPATYVGYSMGGRLALHAALAHPEAVRQLVVLGVTAGLTDPIERAARRAADEALATDLERDGLDAFLPRWLANPLFARLPRDIADVEDRRRNTVGGLASSLRLAGTGTQADLWPRLGELAMPVLVLAGEHDAKFREIGQRLAAAIGNNARFEVVEDAGHAAHLERPANFLAHLRAFLREPGR